MPYSVSDIQQYEFTFLLLIIYKFSIIGMYLKHIIANLKHKYVKKTLIITLYECNYI